MLPMNQRIPDWLAHRASATPDRLAVIFRDKQYSFAELHLRVAGVIRLLEDAGLSPGQRAALLLHNGIHFVDFVHALPRFGAIIVPLNTRLTAEELSWQIHHADCRLLIYDEANAGKAREIIQQAPHLIRLQAEEFSPPSFPPAAHAAADAREVYVGLDQLHSIIYTSGTTGKPKGTMLTFGNHLWSAFGSVLNLGLRTDDRWLACLPFFHVGGLSILLRSVLYGIPAVIHERFHPSEVNASIDRHRVTLISVVSNMLARMIEERGAKPYPDHLRCVLVGGGPVPRPLLEECQTRGIPVVQTYGLTETASQTATLAPEEALRKLGSAGKPLFPTELRIERDGRSVPPHVEGEITVRGPNVTLGYDQLPEETEQAFRGGWFHTGDWGYLDEEGYLYVLDRRKDLIISGGENVYPAEVEAALLAHPAVQEAGVTGLPDERWGQVPVAAVRCRPGHTVTAEELHRFLQSRLAKYKLPVKYRFVEQLPRTASGKLQRHALVQFFREGEPDR